MNFTKTKHLSSILALLTGGTGRSIDQAVQSLVGHLPAEVRRAIQSFHIDADAPEEDGRSCHAYYDDLNAFQCDAWRLFREERFTGEPCSKRLRTTAHGVGAERPLGVASLVASSERVRACLEQAHGGSLASMGRPIDRVAIGFGGEGGFGSATALDLAAIVHKYFAEQTGRVPPIDLFMTGSSVLYDGQIDPATRDHMRANHYALIKELNHYATHPFRTHHRLSERPITVRNVSGEQLFEWVYYVDAAIPIAAATHMIAEFIVHLGASEVGRRIASLIPNEIEKRDLHYPVNFVHPSNRKH